MYHPYLLRPEGRPPVECFELSAEESRALPRDVKDKFMLEPVFPHGEWIAWGG